MSSALVPLANLTLGSSQATVTFSGISGVYRDLYLVISGTPASSDIYMQFNDDTTAANYTWVSMRGDGTSATSATGTTAIVGFGIAGQSICSILDYSATDKHKSILLRMDYASNGTNARAIRWANTAAITKLVLTNPTFPAGFTVALYGIVG